MFYLPLFKGGRRAFIFLYMGCRVAKNAPRKGDLPFLYAFIQRAGLHTSYPFPKIRGNGGGSFLRKIPGRSYLRQRHI
jgi:hypothetical protein